MEAATLLQILLWGVYAGCIYVLLTTGLTLIFGVMKLVNFAHGEFLMLGAFLAYFASQKVHPYFAIIIAMILMFFIGIGVERSVFRPVLGSGKLNEIIVSLGLIMVMQNSVAQIWGNEDKWITSPYAKKAYPVLGVHIPFDYVVIFIVTALVLVLLYLFLSRTKLGRAMRATSENREAAKLVGIDVERIDMLAFGIGSALAALAGGLWAVSGISFNYASGSLPAIKAFAVIIIGGLGSIPGAIVGGLLLGIAESFAAFFLGAAWKDAISFILLTLVLLLKPTGIFGGEE